MSEQSDKKTTKEKSNSNTKIIFLLGLLTALFAATSLFFFFETTNMSSSSIEVSDAQLAERNQEESGRVLGQLEAILEFEEENPTVARIDDAMVLRESNPEFYAKAETGDFLVLFPSRAVVYREEINKIINFAPIINTNEIDQAVPEGS